MRPSFSWFLHLTTAVVVALGVLFADAAPLAGQYFGRNNVQYEDFDFRILRTPHFDVYYYPDEEVAARDAARMAERWYLRLSRLLNHEFTERQPLILYGSHPAFQQSAFLGGIGEGTQGVTESAKQRIAMPLLGSYEETDHVLGHELVHAFQYDMSGLGRNRGTPTPAARALATAPLWFIEGMAEYLSGGPVDANAAMHIRDGALTGRIPTVEQLTTDPRFFPYTWGHSFWAYVGGRWGDAVIGQILRQVGQGVPYEESFERILNTDLEEIAGDWAASIRRAYLPLLAERPEAREVARPLITQRTEGGRINLGPAISPDGRYVAFLSELDFFDIELWLADAQTGEIIRKLQKGTAFDPHFQSLRFLNSAGSWSPDSRRFVFSALRGGKDRLVVLDAQRADIVQEIKIPEISEITTPSWSPDGRYIVFSGIEGGISDLYLYDLETEQTRRLTEDRFANLHPYFSPDGGTIAFVTEEGPNTNLGALEFGGYNVALLDVATGETRLAPRMGEGNNINPVYTPDGTGLYFISDRSGIPNIYRVQLATGELFQVTELFGGVSGITDISPAMSVSRDTGRLLFTAYENTGYNIYALGTPQELAGDPVPVVEGGVAGGPPTPAMLPPIPRPAEAAFNRVATLLDDPQLGLPAPGADEEWPVVPYRPRFTLDYLGQPQVGVSAGGVLGGTGLYGGIAALFSDMLGYHTLFTTVQAQGQIDEVGFSTVYLYRKNRWNYGVAAQRVPYVYGFFQQGLDQGDDTFKQQIVRARFFDTSLQGVAHYPFSTVMRAELAGGVRRFSNDFQIFERSFDPATGAFLGERQFNEDGEAFNLGEATAALVYDNALFGFTSPFAGQRYRFEVSPTLGDLSFTQVVADYRRYFFMRPFTLAFQGMHFGRYGPDADEETLFTRPIFLGYPSLVRGYWDALSDCRDRTVQDPEPCDLLNESFGSRIAVAKAELRFPLIRQLVLGTSIPFPPIEGIAFFDAGVAWNAEDDLVLQRGLPRDVEGALIPGQRGILTSAGVGARINLLGYVILEVDYVNALDWDGRGWHWQFALQPGF